jgi:basic membrane protein A
VLLAAVAGAAAERLAAAPSATQRVGLVIQGGLEDHGLNQLAYEGLVRAERELGVKGRVLQADSSSGTARNLGAFARQGFDLVVAVGQGTADATAAAAKRFPDTRFAIVDADQRSLDGRPRNVTGLVFDEHQVGYVVGYLAALTAKRRGGRVVGAVGGAEDPGAARLFSGYRSGARRAVPGIRVARDPGESDADGATCKRLALAQIEEGAVVVLGASGACGRGSLDAARQGRAWGIGVDADESVLGPFVLTSAVKGSDVAVFAVVRSLSRGKLAGGRNLRFGLAGGGVRHGAVSPRAAQADVNATRRVEQLLSGGARVGDQTTSGG